jgi:hypothetical protein
MCVWKAWSQLHGGVCVWGGGGVAEGQLALLPGGRGEKGGGARYPHVRHPQGALRPPAPPGPRRGVRCCRPSPPGPGAGQRPGQGPRRRRWCVPPHGGLAWAWGVRGPTLPQWHLHLHLHQQGWGVEPGMRKLLPSQRQRARTRMGGGQIRPTKSVAAFRAPSPFAKSVETQHNRVNRQQPLPTGQRARRHKPHRNTSPHPRTVNCHWTQLTCPCPRPCPCPCPCPGRGSCATRGGEGPRHPCDVYERAGRCRGGCTPVE